MIDNLIIALQKARESAGRDNFLSAYLELKDAVTEFIEDTISIPVDKPVSPIFTDEEHRILKLLLASKIAEIQVNIVYDEPVEQRMGKVKLINILNDINEKVKIRR